MNNGDRHKRTNICHKLAHFLTYHGIQNNEFICAICGKQPIEKHHENYDLWNVFIPLCNKHHALTKGNTNKQNKLKQAVTKCQNAILPTKV